MSRDFLDDKVDRDPELANNAHRFLGRILKGIPPMDQHGLSEPEKKIIGKKTELLQGIARNVPNGKILNSDGQDAIIKIMTLTFGRIEDSPDAPVDSDIEFVARIIKGLN